ncbi:hypothetical protein [Roseateles saccharophilus]|uniref:Cytochrome c domain-containing protein n=1 Tax=Roseateles saccharophilus TaxID=304 RepID=A0A4R3VHK8_ROSSA|nr:hypothetical protein [Roseateles saccharophilus]MDG0832161.1 hypothetical protein [Roseateles saccharophilus]TCV03573.1 hypothetical protein EV671_1003231 [Roseateles saccharophilus]
MKTSAIRLGATGALLVGMAGCGGGGGYGGSSGSPGTDPNPPMTATFASIQSHVFTPICSACHAGAAAPQGLKLDVANSYMMLVNVASAEVPSIKRVAPGDAANSYIVQKLEGHAAVGARMPFGGPYLDATTIGLIRQWIDNGAAQ